MKQILLTFKHLLLLLVFFGISNQVKADYIAAADLEYRCIGNDRYKVTITLYTECGSNLVNGDNVQTLKLNLTSESLATGNILVVAEKVPPLNGTEVKIFCEKQKTNCSIGGTDRGLKKYTYEVEIDLLPLGKAVDWKLFMQPDFRSKFITTASVSTIPYYVEATIDNTLGCNSSPTFGEVPLLRGCVGETDEISLFPNDPDGNTLVYSFVSPKSTPDDEITYTGIYNELFPVDMSGPIEISDGVIKFSSTVNNQIGITDLKIVEKQGDGQTVGSVTKGIQISTYSCTNNKPVISGLNNVDGVFEASVCVGETFNDTIFGTEPDLDQLIGFEIITVAKNGVLQFSRGTNATAIFDWTPTPSEVGRYEFNLRLKDDGCPINQFTTQTFVVNVNSIPTFSLGADKIVPCNENIILDPIVSLGEAPYTKTWVSWGFRISGNNDTTITILDTFAVSETYEVTNPGLYGAFLSDVNGCSSFDGVWLKSGLFADFEYFRYCEGQTTEFADSSESEGSDIVKWTWDFDDNGATATTQNATHKFNDDQVHFVKLIVENEVECTDTVIRPVKICNPPSIGFIRTDSCSRTPITLLDTTDYSNECSVNRRSWYLNGSNFATFVPPFIPEDVIVSVPDSGWYDIRLEIQTRASCVIDTVIPMYFYPKPEIEFREDLVELVDFSINCADSDTTLKAVIVDTGNGDLAIDWINPGETQIDPLTYFVNDTGAYTIYIEDKLGCNDQTEVKILYPVLADFVYEVVCSDTDSMRFENQSIVTTTLKEYIWNFGDGSPLVNDTNPVHLFPEKKDYQVILTVVDTNECPSMDTLVVYNTNILESMTFSPDFRTTIVCAKNPITGTLDIVNPLGDHIDEIIWNYGYDGINRRYNNDPFDLTKQGTVGQGFVTSPPIQFPDDNKYYVTASVEYNKHIGIHDSSCIRIFIDSIEVLPLFEGEILENKVCTGDTAEFYFVRTDANGSDGSVVNFLWEFKKRQPDFSFITVDFSFNNVGELFVDPVGAFAKDSEFYTFITVEDSLGCQYRDNAPFTVAEIEKPEIIYEPACANGGVEIDVYHFLNTRGANVYYIEDLNRNRLHDDYLSYLPFNADRLLLDKPKNGFGPFKPGDNRIRVFVSERLPDEDQPSGFKECRGVLDTTIELYDVPVAGFKSDTVCSKYFVTTLTDTSTITVGSSIESYGWIFEDSTTSASKDTSYIFFSGSDNIVKHFAVSDKGCADTISRPVYVDPTPDANFRFDPDSSEVEAFKPIDFIDESNFYGTVPDSAWYEFGDGSPRENTFDANHVYDTVKMYYVTHAVNNTLGCWDTIVKKTDLNVYLDIANVFSPNNDGLNDDIGLIYKGIRELYEFKIFNRWGEVVFDAEGNLQARWDGTFRGIDQEIGGYVVHVKALGAYDKEFNFKRNVSLIR